MTKPTDQLEAIIELAQAALVGWPAYEATEAALANSTIPTTGGGTHGGDVADPVAAIAMSHERYYETAATLAEILGGLRNVQRRMATVRRNHAETHDVVEAAVRAARCDGVIGTDPTCTRNAVTNVRRNGIDHATCWACKKRDQRTQAEAGDAEQAAPAPGAA